MKWLKVVLALVLLLLVLAVAGMIPLPWAEDSHVSPPVPAGNRG
jgi:hypothetical protein